MLPPTRVRGNGVGTPGMGAEGGCHQRQMQDRINKVDDLINTVCR